jgi:hypothetical protein
MPLLPRFTETHIESERKIAKVLLESGAALPVVKTLAGLARFQMTPAELRGIPAVARSVAGAIPGTNPLSALLRSVRSTGYAGGG